MRHLTFAAAILLLLPGRGGAETTSTIAEQAQLGPSFACSTARDPLARLICASPDLARTDLAFVQAYQAYRQQLGEDGQKELLTESIRFGVTVRAACTIVAAPGIVTAGVAPNDAVSCVRNAYERQRAAWLTRLTGAAAEEAGRSLEQHVALQADLHAVGLLAPSEPIDGVYGGATRFAIIAFQETMDLPASGLLGDRDADLLRQQASRGQGSDAGAFKPPAPEIAAPAARSAWERFRAEAIEVGVEPLQTVSTDSCRVVLDIRNPDVLATASATHGRDAGDAKDDDATRAFESMLSYLSTDLSARAVRALYADHPAIDRCIFTALTYTTDVYGRDVAHELFSFTFDRADFEKIVWARFDPANLPRIATVVLGAFARDRLRGTGGDQVGPGADGTPVTAIPSIPAPLVKADHP